jgi:hypothetical protein
MDPGPFPVRPGQTARSGRERRFEGVSNWRAATLLCGRTEGMNDHFSRGLMRR